MIDSPRSPKDHRSAVAKTVRDWRSEAGLNQDEVAKLLGWSLSKVVRIETAQVSLTVDDAKALAKAYRQDNPHAVERLLYGTKASRKREWFAAYKKYMSPAYQELVSYERSASEIGSVNSFLMPGLLQTPEYARELLSLRHSGKQLQMLLDARKERQEILTSQDGPRFQFLVNEALLRHKVGGPNGLIRQLDSISAAASLPTVDFRVLPLAAGAHYGMWEQFLVLRLHENSLSGLPSETVIYREVGDTESLIRGNPERITYYERAYAEVEKHALSAADSLRLLSTIRAQVDTDPSA